MNIAREYYAPYKTPLTSICIPRMQPCFNQSKTCLCPNNQFVSVVQCKALLLCFHQWLHEHVIFIWSPFLPLSISTCIVFWIHWSICWVRIWSSGRCCGCSRSSQNGSGLLSQHWRCRRWHFRRWGWDRHWGWQGTVCWLVFLASSGMCSHFKGSWMEQMEWMEWMGCVVMGDGGGQWWRWQTRDRARMEPVWTPTRWFLRLSQNAFLVSQHFLRNMRNGITIFGKWLLKIALPNTHFSEMISKIPIANHFPWFPGIPQESRVAEQALSLWYALDEWIRYNVFAALILRHTHCQWNEESQFNNSLSINSLECFPAP